MQAVHKPCCRLSIVQRCVNSAAMCLLPGPSEGRCIGLSMASPWSTLYLSSSICDLQCNAHVAGHVLRELAAPEGAVGHDAGAGRRHDEHRVRVSRHQQHLAGGACGPGYRAGGHPSTRSGHVLKTCFNQTVLRMQNWQVAMRGSIEYCCQQAVTALTATGHLLQDEQHDSWSGFSSRHGRAAHLSW
jgi:hypothetical protein